MRGKPFIFIAFMPYLFILTAFFVVSSVSAIGPVFSIILVLFSVLMVLFSVWLSAHHSLKHSSDYTFLLMWAMIISFAHILAYYYVFLGAVITSIFSTDRGEMLITALVMFIIDAFFIATSGIVGMVGVINSYKDGCISKRRCVIYSILQFIFLINIPASIIIFIQIKGINKKKLKDEQKSL